MVSIEDCRRSSARKSCALPEQQKGQAVSQRADRERRSNPHGGRDHQRRIRRYRGAELPAQALPQASGRGARRHERGERVAEQHAMRASFGIRGTEAEPARRQDVAQACMHQRDARATLDLFVEPALLGSAITADDHVGTERG
ncbi:MAG: hypothetical protein M5U08_11295 [Burkholderiales bacterium]|nr:hypothetical protein [Burkholderiales bacterium]